MSFFWQVQKTKKWFCLSSFLWFGTSFTSYWFVLHFPCDKIYLLVNTSYDILSTKTISSLYTLAKLFTTFFFPTLYYFSFHWNTKNQNKNVNKAEQNIDCIFPVILRIKTKMGAGLCGRPPGSIQDKRYQSSFQREALVSKTLPPSLSYDKLLVTALPASPRHGGLAPLSPLDSSHMPGCSWGTGGKVAFQGEVPNSANRIVRHKAQIIIDT